MRRISLIDKKEIIETIVLYGIFLPLSITVPFIGLSLKKFLFIILPVMGYFWVWIIAWYIDSKKKGWVK